MNAKFKIGVLEFYPLNMTHINVDTVSVMSRKVPPSYHKYHGDNVVTIIIETMYYILSKYMTDSDILNSYSIKYSPRWENTLHYAMINEFNIINLSSDGMDYINIYSLINTEKQCSEKVLMLCASGNGGEGNETLCSLRESWHSVGAINESEEIASYSAWNNDGDVLCMGISGLNNGYENRVIDGTSYSTPYVTGVLSAIAILHNKYFGFYPTKEYLLEWVKRNAKDLDIKGKDYKTGFGLVSKECEIKFYCAYYDYDKKTVTQISVINGVTSITSKITMSYRMFQRYGQENSHGVKYQSRAWFGNVLKISTFIN